MQKVANFEVSLDFSNIKLDELEAYRNDLRDDIDKVGKENIQTLYILKLALSDVNHAILLRKLYQHKHHTN